MQFARSAGATVFERDWTDFVDARRFALEQVETPWVLMIDADEALDDVLRDAIGSAAENVDAYVVRRTTYFCGHPMRIWSNEPLVRLFRRDRVKLAARPAAAGEAPIHEAWTSDGPTSELPGTLLHYSYPDAAAYRAKYDRYTTLEAQQMHASAAGLAAGGRHRTAAPRMAAAGESGAARRSARLVRRLSVGLLSGRRDAQSTVEALSR